LQPAWRYDSKRAWDSMIRATYGCAESDCAADDPYKRLASASYRAVHGMDTPHEQETPRLRPYGAHQQCRDGPLLNPCWRCEIQLCKHISVTPHPSDVSAPGTGGS
jgi:hypothetical protein